MPAAVVDEKRAYLQKVDDAGVSVYGHITEVLARILTAQPENALDALESVSLEAKAGYFDAASTLAPAEPSSDLEHPSEWQVNTNALLTAPVGEDGAEVEEDDSLVTPNLLEEMTFFELSGVGLSREETHRVFASIHKLQQSKKLSSARLFGKILGTAKDYYVVEAKYVDEPERPEPEEGAPPPTVPLEASSEGCNTFAYFVTNDPSQEWTELPQVKPDQISAALLIRKLFTGDLQADVRAYPPFPGKEKEYLRAQIARIWTASTLCPKNKFTLDPEDPGELPFGVKPNDDYLPPPSSAMLQADHWCKSNASVLAIGRCTNPPKEEEEEGEEGAAKPKEPEPEKETPALTPASEAEWSTQLFSRLGAGSAVAVARSLRWPGAFSAAVMKEDKCSNLYIGYGHEALGAPFRPQAPPTIESEPDDLSEQVDMPLAEENALFRAEAEKNLLEAPEEEPAVDE
jgi:radial spoke head protein 4A